MLFINLSLVSDDFFSPENWDVWLKKQFKNFNGGIMVRDGYQTNKCITIPIMTYGCLLALNRIIYHPSYTWQFSDEELYHNISGLKMLKNLRKKGMPLFEHRHWTPGKRKMDEHDQLSCDSGGRDHQNFLKRMKMPLKKRLV